VSGTKMRTLRRPKLDLGRARVVRTSRNLTTGDVITSVQVDNRISSSSGLQKTKSEGHPWKSRPKGFSGDLGGDFWTWRVENRTPKASESSWGYSVPDVPGVKTTMTYNASLYAANPEALSTPPDLSSSDSALMAKGTTAVALCKPTNSVADLSVAMGELVKDRLPSIPILHGLESRIKLAVKAGDEFLNVVFGWEPLVADVKKTAAAIVEAQKVIDQFERDSGRQVRRRFEFDTEKSTDSTIVATGVEPWYGTTSSGPLDTDVGSGPLIRTRQINRKTWFSGAFMYHIPKNFFGTREIAAKADKLLGLELTPSVLWELTPWSWAIDWVTNVGDGISNLSDWQQFGLVMRYGYIMETTSVTDTYTLSTNGPYGPFAVIAPVVIDTTVKKRLKANPFGFGVDWNGLNSIQLAILGALGLTRS
jgi:hypothetical protein